MQAFEDTLEAVGLVPVITIDQAGNAVPLARALIDGDLPVAEITLRTPAAVAAIRQIATAVPSLLVGAGTVLTRQQAEQAVDAGAQFLVSPGCDRALIEWCQARQVLMIPGVATASDVILALTLGIRLVKFFPAAELGGVPMLKALGGPFGDVRFLPTGGITAATLADYLHLTNVAAVGGSWMATATMITAQQFATITQLATAARQVVHQVRGEDEVKS